MFTGIVERTGVVERLQTEREAARLVIRAPGFGETLRLGESVAVNGTCLTVVDRRDSLLSFDAVPETMRRTNLGKLREGSRVNLEAPVAAGQPMGGHFVQGHVDDTATLLSIQEEQNARVLTIKPPGHLMRYLVQKGSVALDGISLTVAGVQTHAFQVWIIPHTWERTNLSDRRPGDALNIEVDMLARYLERLLEERAFQLGR